MIQPLKSLIEDQESVHTRTVSQEVMLNENASAMMPSRATRRRPSLQLESYHSTEQPTVVTVASNERAVINPRHLEGSDGTLRQALQLWNSQQGPVTYNQWMSAFFAMTRDFRMTDTEAPLGEGQSAKQKRIRAMFNEIQTELHGADFLAQAVMRDSERTAARQNLRRTAAQDLPSRGEEAEAQLAPVANGPLHGMDNPLERDTRDPEGRALPPARQDLSRTAAQDLLGRRAEEFTLALQVRIQN